MISRTRQAKLFLITFLLLLFTHLPAQTDNSIHSENQQTIPTIDNSAVVSDSVSMLPNNYLFTQKIVWGKKGLMRNFNSYKLSTTEREREMNIRDKMISAHQYTGYATLAFMAFEGVNGILLYKGNNGLKSVHGGMAVVTNICYFTSAGLAFFAPPPMHDREEGWNSVRIHKILSVVHFSSMIATNVLGGLTKDNPHLGSYHCAAACTAFTAMLVSTIIIEF